MKVIALHSPKRRNIYGGNLRIVRNSVEVPTMSFLNTVVALGLLIHIRSLLLSLAFMAFLTSVLFRACRDRHGILIGYKRSQMG